MSDKNTMPEQLVLFPFDDQAAESPEEASHAIPSIPAAPKPAPAPKTAVPAAKAPAKPSPKPKPVLKKDPDYDNIRKKIQDYAVQRNARDILQMAGVLQFKGHNERLSIWNGSRSVPYCYSFDSQRSTTCKPAIPEHVYGFTFSQYSPNDCREEKQVQILFHIMYVTCHAETAVLPVRMTFEKSRGANNTLPTLCTMDIVVGKPSFPEKYLINRLFIQDDDEIRDILSREKPWLTQYLQKNPTHAALRNIVSAPWLETLDKAGYQFARFFIDTEPNTIDQTEIDRFNRLCAPGSSPKEIFRCRKAVYTTLKNETEMPIWDVLRRMEKKEAITGDTIHIVYNRGWNEKTLEMANSILGQTYNGKKVFTWETLVNYLNRLDMYEAIDEREAMPLLKDYLNMCNLLQMEPRIDGDSLKREHDIAAKLIRLKRNNELNDRMKERAALDEQDIRNGNTRLARSTYSEKVYSIRPVRDYDDLLDEARQQHNCVASYAQWIIDGKTRIYFMRETGQPDRSLITVELSPDCRTIRQKCLARNKNIHNKGQSEFLERWLRQMNAA